jgi:hypothetical protein
VDSGFGRGNHPSRPREGRQAPDRPSAGIHRAGRDAQLDQLGWTRRFVGGPPQLEDQVSLYESLGQEVLLDPVTDEELAEDCAGCALALSLFRVVYTRSVK